MSNPFIEGVKASKAKAREVSVDRQLDDAIESDAPFMPTFIIPSIDTLILLGAQWEVLKHELLTQFKNEDNHEEYRKACQHAVAFMRYREKASEGE